MLTWHACCLKHLKYRSHNAQTRRSVETSGCIFETNKNSVGPHGFNIYNTAVDMDMEKCVPAIINIMSYCTGNVCYVVVINDQVLSYPVSRKI